MREWKITISLKSDEEALLVCRKYVADRTDDYSILGIEIGGTIVSLGHFVAKKDVVEILEAIAGIAEDEREELGELVRIVESKLDN
jgi:hypothetical protein